LRLQYVLFRHSTLPEPKTSAMHKVLSSLEANASVMPTAGADVVPIPLASAQDLVPLHRLGRQDAALEELHHPPQLHLPPL
jgi:hypothetical protein